MPEGDVLLRVTRRLHGALAGREVTRSELRSGTLGDADLTGQSVTDCVSYGKNTLIRFDSGRTLHVHLKMDGVWWVEATTRPPAHYGDWRIRIVLGNSEWTCVCRLAGEVRLLRTADEHRLLGALGPDLLAGEPGAHDAEPANFPRISAAALRYAAAQAGPQGTIGAVLLNQRIAAGIGTIYLAESLWITRVHPLTPAASLTEADLERIYHTASALMARSASAEQLTATGDLRPGWRTHVHGREHLPCRRCGQQIAKVSIGRAPRPRPGFYCPRCQPRRCQPPDADMQTGP